MQGSWAPPDLFTIVMSRRARVRPGGPDVGAMYVMRDHGGVATMARRDASVSVDVRM